MVSRGCLVLLLLLGACVDLSDQSFARWPKTFSHVATQAMKPRPGTFMGKLRPNIHTAATRPPAAIRPSATTALPNSQWGRPGVFRPQNTFVSTGLGGGIHPLLRPTIKPPTGSLAKKYTTLTPHKLYAQYLVDEPVTLAHGMAKITPNTVTEGTCAYGGILPDVVVDQDAVNIIKSMVEAVCPEDLYVDKGLTCIQRTIRTLLPNTDPDDFSDFCKEDTIAAYKDRDQAVPLSVFIDSGMGDCRINALSLAIGLSHMEETGQIADVTYTNRHWGSVDDTAKPSPDLVGNAGDHTLLTFRYVDQATGQPQDQRHFIDTYAIKYDRVPVDGDDGVAGTNDWYDARKKRSVGTTNNVWADMVADGTFAQLVSSMQPRSVVRFLEQAMALDNPAWASLSKRLEYPTIAVAAA